MKVHRGKSEARSEGILLYTFLRISPRKINILKKSKLDTVELNEFDNINLLRTLLNLTNILKSITKMPKK